MNAGIADNGFPAVTCSKGTVGTVSIPFDTKTAATQVIPMSKGSRREREAVSLYQDAGMGTYRPATVRFGENDIMGLFDLLAFSPRHESVHAIQVKSNGARGITSWATHTALFRALGFRTFYLCPYDNQGWKLIEIDAAGEKQTRVDEREHTCSMGLRVKEWLENERAGLQREQ